MNEITYRVITLGLNKVALISQNGKTDHATYEEAKKKFDENLSRNKDIHYIIVRYDGDEGRVIKINLAEM